MFLSFNGTAVISNHKSQITLIKSYQHSIFDKLKLYLCGLLYL